MIPDWVFAAAGPDPVAALQMIQMTHTPEQVDAMLYDVVVEQLERDVLVARGVADGSVVLFPSSSEVA